MIHSFSIATDNLPLPQLFTYPFHYTPHPLCVNAAEAVQQYLHTRTDWHEELQQGKRFGVLVVKSPTGEVGFLAAFSGNLAGSNHHDYFVPPVYDLLNPDGYFKEEEARISAINVMLNNIHDNNAEIIETLKEERKQRSIALQQWIFEQFRLRNARGEEQDIYRIFTQTAHRNPPAGTGECAAPKLLQYAYLNNLQPLAMAEFWWGDSPKGEIRRHGHYYPACRHKCEPILNFMLQGLEVEPNPLLTSNTDATQLETVYEDDYLLVVNKPAGMLSVPGKTGQASVLTLLQERYPDATGPILVHRLDMATSGLLLAAKDKDTHALLQKQFEGRTVKKRYIALLEGIPQAEPKGFIRLPLRPDFDNRPLQMVCYEYGKPAVTRYVIQTTEGRTKPLEERLDVFPCKVRGVQCPERRGSKDLDYTNVDAHEILRSALDDKKETQENKTGRTLIAFYPETGRTHQLRVHAAHPEGLNCPIVGDPLYGQPANRLYLHAERLEFRHPVTGQRLQIQKEAPF